MDRLTYRDERGFTFKVADASVYNTLCRLCEYEDTGLTPSEIKDMRNELCLLCGKYKLAHEGACGGCRWQRGEENES